MSNALWAFIEKTKNGKVYETSVVQYDALKRELTQLDKSTAKAVENAWHNEVSNLMGTEFDKLHIQNGGIIRSGDDGFYMDFANWVMAQGEELIHSFKEKGHTAILDYIQKHEAKEEDYMFECMAYVFHEK